MGAHTLTAREARQKLDEMGRRNAPFEEKARSALELGRQYLGVDNAHLTWIDTETDHWEAIVSTGQGEPLQSGVELDLQTTYCRETIGADGPVTLHDAPSQGWDDDPALEAHGFDCYHGTTLYLDGEPYGTLCFVAEESRETPFGEDETLFVDLIRRLLERELERQQHETELTRRTNLVNILNRVLRHNIRNDMSVIRARTQLMADRLEDPTSATAVLEKIDDLIKLCEKARGVEELVDRNHDRTQTELRTLVQGVVADIEAEFPAASVNVEGDTEVTAQVLPSLERAVRELVENAAKHGGESPAVTVTVEEVAKGVELRVADTGPGLSEQEQQVLKTGVETPLIHGSGLGLWLVHWIAASHDGSVEATVTDTGTRMTVSVPRMPTAGETEDLADLRQARDQYRAAFEEAFDAQLLLDDEARIIEANPEASEIYGLERTALRGRSLAEFFPGEFDFEEAWSTFRDNGRDRNIVTVSGADGQDRQVAYSATSNVVPGQHLLIARDVTERQQRRADLERYETVLDSIDDAAVVYDDTRQITFLNQAALDVLSMPRERILGSSLGAFERLFADPETFDSWESLVEDVLSGAVEAGDLDVRLSLQDRRVTLNLRATPIPGGDSPAGVAVIASDITERKNREQTLEEYETIIESLTDAVYVVDEEGRFTYVNDELVDLVGYERETILGNTSSLFKSRETVEEAERQVGRLLSDDGPETLSFEMTVKPRDGDPVVCRDNMGALPYDGDSFNGSVGTLRDITGRKERERRLAALKERYETLLEAAPNPIFVADYETGRILETNAAAETLLGRPREEIVGQPQSALHPPDQAERYRQFFEEYAQSERALRELPDGSPIYMVTEDCERIPIEISVGTVSLPSGPVILGTFRDITESIEQQRTLNTRNSQLKTALKGMPDPTFVCDVNGEITAVDQAAAERLGHTREEMLSETVSDIGVEASVDDLTTAWESIGPGSCGRLGGSQSPVTESPTRVELWVSPIELAGERRFVARVNETDSAERPN